MNLQTFNAARDLVGARFEAFGYPDFRDSVTLPITGERPVAGSMAAKEKRYRYWRIVFPKNSRGNLASR
ncbi:MAG: hypothetical protein LBR65_09335 [Culturomica sp.]|jgi:hypothetical protein|nr:hypothetical protein [Culturomica sp.]